MMVNYFSIRSPSHHWRLRLASSVFAAAAAAPVIAANSVLAADLPRESSSAPASPAITWTGLYLGVNSGAWFSPGAPSYQAIGGFDLFPNGGAPNAGFTGGFQGGYDYQIDKLLLGFETDFNYLGNCRSGAFAAPAIFANFGGSYSLSGSCSHYFGTMRGRIGYIYDRALFYATAGIAYGGNRDPGSINFNPPAPGNLFTTGASSSSRPKYVFGAGIEYALTDHWFARAEYLYVNLGRIDQTFANGAGRGFFSSSYSENHILRVGLDYKFGDFPSSVPAPALAAAEPAKSDGDAQAAPEAYNFHGQATYLPQYYPTFQAPYSGPHSVPPNSHVEATFTATAFLGLALWQGAAIFLNPEVDEGFGIGDAFGIAGFPNNEAFKVGSTDPYVRIQRYFLRQTVGLGGTTEPVESGQNQLAGSVDANRLTFTIGKYAVTDIFDDNKYAHDGRNGFMNWTTNTMGAFDFAADAWGYTYGLTAEWRQDWWTARAGVFQLSSVPAANSIEPELFRQFMPVVEFEERHAIQEQPGKLKFLFFADDGFMGSYSQAIAEAAAAGVTPDITSVRARRVKVGGGVNLEQQITPSLGLFVRLSAANGQYETYDFTEVERSASGGVVISGDLWGRDNDQIGVSGVLNGISAVHAQYLAAGGIGAILGDGALSYGGEHIFETYYKYAIADGVNVTADYQFVDNPGYNQARGPISLFALRFHAEF